MNIPVKNISCGLIFWGRWSVSLSPLDCIRHILDEINYILNQMRRCAKTEKKNKIFLTVNEGSNITYHVIYSLPERHHCFHPCMMRTRMKTYPPQNLLRIGELARLTRVSTRTIRFYVEEGLLPQPMKTHRNMAYYHPDCIRKIKAIKRAQNERFLPLVVIGRMLQESGHDFSVLESQVSAPSIKSQYFESKNRIEIPRSLLMDIFRRHWISSISTDTLSPSEKCYLDFMNRCLLLGFTHDEIIGSFETLEQFVEKAVKTEFQAFYSRLGNVSPEHFDHFLKSEKQVVQDFMERVRDRSLRNILTKHHRTLDNAVLAIGDEGYGIPLEEVEEDLKQLEKSIKRGTSDVRKWIDLATGYSCVGDQEKAMSFLKRALRRDHENVAARVRWCWYHRFIEENRRSFRWRDRLAQLVQTNPDDIAGHVFLSVWYAFDSTEPSEPFHGLQMINLCLKELRQAQEIKAIELHDWTLFQYAKGLIYTFVLADLREQEQGIRAFEAILSKRSELEAYYAKRMPFFSKWLWPNLLYFLGLAQLETGHFIESEQTFSEACRFRVSSLFRQRVEAGLKSSKEGQLKIKGVSD